MAWRKDVNVYRAQALVLAEMSGRPGEEIVERLVEEVYEPYRELCEILARSGYAPREEK